MSDAPALSRQDHVEINPLYMFRWEDSQDSHILLYPEGVVKLNQTAGAILEQVSKGLSVGELIDELQQDYVDGDVADGVFKFLEMSHAKGWIQRK
ncbi:MAG TPA: pyrroloquinoline quinone biosynthesis peptide chaperone PqqD [Alphaproteobacteria bacterium]|jgi:pyrroloquinoline quinone biosynthesis protein D|nr:pyrroloquinoline quinone biosynthesis peptide chaperone PqqD [Alphaproteobacteria bacterium]